MRHALEGLKVIDLTRVLAGPYATMLLADFGAEIIKIEVPKTGDDSRAFGPYVNGESAYFMSINRNKKSITLNLKTEEGKDILKKLVSQADVLVENFRPGTMEKLGLGYELLKEINPKLIYAASSGYGHTGPYSQKPAYDAVVQAMGGIMSITGQVGGKPTRVGTSIGDIAAGLFTAIGVLTALNYRNETGLGQKVDVAMLDCQVAMLENAIARYTSTGDVPKPGGNKHPSIVPFESFGTNDGDIMVAAGNDNLFQKLCAALNLEAAANDARFASNPLRNENYEALKPMLDKAFAEKSIDEWRSILDEAGVPNSPINTIDRVVEHPQVIARDMVQTVKHKVAGEVKMPGVAVKLSETPGMIETAAPLLGEHNEEILKAYLNMSDEDINSLKEKGVI
ncbi:MAG: CaiB/BaiF CoA transferase family protein [Proteocatella sp.]